MQAVTLMGILNVTPDSFSDGGLYYPSVDAAVARAATMLEEGAAIIDIGGESTRPGAQPLSIEEELQRVIPVIETIRNELGQDFVISVDTYKAPVAKAALGAGAAMVNSLGGFTFDPDLATVVAAAQCQIVIYHIKGEPQTMQAGEIVYDDVIAEIAKFFEAQLALGVQHGVQKEQCILDPGIGFGKTLDHNLKIIRRLGELKRFDLPLLVGVSRKIHLGKLLQQKLALSAIPEPTERLEAALAETAVAVLHGASIIRTHDVAATKRFLVTLEELL